MSENTHWARLVEREGGALVAFEIIPFDPEGRFDASLRFEPCPPETRQGSVYDPQDDTWTHPAESEPSEPVPAEPQYTTFVSVPRFVASFGATVAIKIARARAYVPPDPNAKDEKADIKYGLDYFFNLLELLNNERKDVDVSDPSVISALNFLRVYQFMTQDQVDEILRGLPVEV